MATRHSPHGPVTDLVELLLWSAGHPTARCVAEAADDAFLVALREHRLTGAFVARTAGEPHALPAAVVAAARAQHATAAARFHRLCEVAREVSADWPDPQAPLVVLKGPTAYAATGIDALIYGANDVDVIGPDAEAVAAHLQRHGFTVREGVRLPHEWGTVARDDVHADVHHWFPVPGPAAGVTDGRTPPPDAVPYDVIAANLLPARGSTVPGVRTAAPALALVLLAAHIYRDFRATALPLPYATVRLGELVAAIRLSAAPGCSPEAVAALAETAGAAEAVGFLAYQAHALLGTGALAPLRRADTAYPFELWRQAFLADDGRAAAPRERLVVRAAPDDMTALARSLGAAPTAFGEGAEVAVRPGDAGVRVRGQVAHARIRLAHGPAGLTVEATVPADLPAGSAAAAYAYFGDVELIGVWAPGGPARLITRDRRQARAPGLDACAVSAAVAEGAVTVRLLVPWPVAAAAADARRIGLLAGARVARAGAEPEFLAVAPFVLDLDAR